VVVRNFFYEIYALFVDSISMFAFNNTPTLRSMISSKAEKKALMNLTLEYLEEKRN
jgi:hypothetical protein